ncbi:MAG: helix-turn-helix transcriptional regulator [Treponema sp.]|nr:helix-turn-helix transcriptional regulator [Treponema sp.]
MIFENNIHMLRYEAKMKQEELAELVGVRRETIGLLERGRYNPSLFLATSIANVFGKKVEEIFQFFPETTEERRNFEEIDKKREELQKEEKERKRVRRFVKVVAPDRL